MLGLFAAVRMKFALKALKGTFEAFAHLTHLLFDLIFIGFFTGNRWSNCFESFYVVLTLMILSWPDTSISEGDLMMDASSGG